MCSKIQQYLKNDEIFSFFKKVSSRDKTCGCEVKCPLKIRFDGYVFSRSKGSR
jgi:hypothetical protein